MEKGKRPGFEEWGRQMLNGVVKVSLQSCQLHMNLRDCGSSPFSVWGKCTVVGENMGAQALGPFCFVSMLEEPQGGGVVEGSQQRALSLQWGR